MTTTPGNAAHPTSPTPTAGTLTTDLSGLVPEPRDPRSSPVGEMAPAPQAPPAEVPADRPGGAGRWVRVAVGVAVVDAALAAGSAPWMRRARWVTKPAVVPAIAAAVHAGGGRPDPALRTALVASWAGDVALLSTRDAGFLAGVTGFAAAHLAYLQAIRSTDTAPPRTGSSERLVGGVFAVTGVGSGLALWRRLGAPGERRLRGPVLGYAALVSTMGAAAARTGLRSGDRTGRALAAGGALFVLSDGLVALSHFGRHRRPAVDAAVMATYATAQALLATALTRRPHPTDPLTPGPSHV